MEPSYSEDGDPPTVPAPASYARFQGVEIDSPDEDFFSPIRLADLPEEYGQDEEAPLLRYRFEPGSKDYYLVVTEGSKTANTLFGKQVVQHLSDEIVRMTQDITFLANAHGRTTRVKGPVEFVALFESDFGCPYGWSCRRSG